MEEKLNKLQNYIQQIAEENNYANARIDIQPVSSGGANYTSDLFVVTVSAPPKEDLHLFAKVANLAESIRDETEAMNLLYQTEHVFYSELVTAFNNLYNKYNVPEENRLYITKYYGYKADKLEETLVLENLVAKRFGNFNRLKTFNWDYASKAVEQLARFHALGVALKEENLEAYTKIIKKIGVDMLTNKAMINIFIDQAIKMGTEFVKHEYRGKLQKYLNHDSLLKDLNHMFKKADNGFLIHGDYRPSNLMHRRRNGKMEVVPLDYQTCREGKFVADLMYFIWSSSDSQFRKLYYRHLLEHYYAALAQALRDLHVDVTKVYPREAFERDLEETKTMGLYMGLTMMNVLTVDPDDAPTMDDMANFAILPNQLGLDRMNDIVGDYVSKGII